MKSKIILLTILACWLSCSTTFARIAVSDTPVTKKILLPVKKFYVGTALDGAIFSTATRQKNTTPNIPGPTTNSVGALRFTCFLNVGFTFNFNLNRHLGIYTGIDVKNVGFIEDNAGGETVKRRSYNIGAPIGIKIGNMAVKKTYLFLGGGADAPFNYREKTFSVRDQKTKFSEWFSQRTPSVMPYVFAGFAINHGFTLKGQYYPGNFLNPNFTTNGAKPYDGYDVHLILVSLGYAVPVKKQHDLVTKEITHLDSQ